MLFLTSFELRICHGFDSFKMCLYDAGSKGQTISRMHRDALLIFLISCKTKTLFLTKIRNRSKSKGIIIVMQRPNLKLQLDKVVNMNVFSFHARE